MNNAADQLRVGVQLPTREHAIAGNLAVGPLLEYARRAETLGLDSLWTGDSLTARPRLDPIVVLSAVAAVTRRMTLGTAALTAALRHPLIGAHQIASLQHAAEGRLEIGLGSGFPVAESAEEFAAVGVPFTARAARLDEVVRIWRSIWSATNSGHYEGRFWQLSGLDKLPAPATPGGPRLWLAASDTPSVLSRVATHYDGWLPFLPTTAAYARAWSNIRALAAAAGRGEPDAIVPGLYATVLVDDDPERARTTLDRYVHGYYRRPLEFMTSIQAYYAGTAADCAQWLDDYVKAGARHIVLRAGSLDPADQLDRVAEVRNLLLAR